ncbi:YcdB/YcdC domain-containing protein [Paenibacillus sp. J22TS3]|uniref:YcdB/YcdC domain-containing protein n=1 Tax=Paenibacillus sp. J22TS3 TaxID=2807192 RepID=UPI001B1435D5|nr:YcdB/YcdC domain-containing protein [Paenibacillus sp. J22TS3]GIP23969.1 hypothetical protein J22TS3_42440 [Paenibacillus sp. J22TS3]
MNEGQHQISKRKGRRLSHSHKALSVAAGTLTLVLLLTPAAVWADSSSTTKIDSASSASGSTTVRGSATGSTANSPSVVSDKVPTGAKISSAQAEKLVLEMFPLLSKAKLTSVSFGDTNRYPVDYDKKWNLEYTYQYGNSSMGFDARVDGVTGEVLSVNLPERLIQTYSRPDAAKVDEAAAKKIALEWIAKKVKGLDTTTLKEDAPFYMGNNSLFGSQSYYFSFDVPVNGIISNYEKLQVTVNYNGEVTGYYRNKSFSAYPSSKPAISLEAAEKTFREGLEIELAYVPDQMFSRQPAKYFLGYVPSQNSANSIDAHTGKKTVFPPTDQLEPEFKPESIPVGKGAVYATSKTPILDDDAAVERLHALVEVPKSYAIVNKQLSKSGRDNQKVWNLSLNQKQDNNGFTNDSIFATIDAENGRLVSFNYNDYGPKRKEYKPSGKIITPAEAKARALEIVQNLIPNASAEFKLTSVTNRDPKDPSSTYVYSFKRYLNGILVFNDFVNLSLSSDGAVRDFSTSINADTSSLPASKPAISKEEAKKRYLDDTKLELRYESTGGSYQLNGNVIPESNKLVYAPIPVNGEDTYYSFAPINAITGARQEIYSSTGETKLKEVKDIQGHPLEKALTELVKYRVLVPDQDGKVKPNEPIAQGDWMIMASRAYYPDLENYYGSEDGQPIGGIEFGTEYYKAIQTYISNNWITINPDIPLNLTNKLTRERLAEYLVEMLHYKKLADFYSQPSDLAGVSDAASISNKGDVSIALRLKLMDVKDGKFEPDRIVTRAEAADVLIRLKALIGKTDSFLEQFR